MEFLKKLFSIDRRFIYLVVFLAVAIPIIYPLNLPVRVTDEVQTVYNDIEKLPEGSPILIAVDYEPSSSPELNPMTRAILKHCFRKNLRVFTTTIWPTDGSGAAIADKLLEEEAKLAGKVRGKDYVNLGFKSGGYAVVIGMGEDFQKTFPKDFNGTVIDNMDIFKGNNSNNNPDAALPNAAYSQNAHQKIVKSLKDFSYMVCIHDDSSVFTWITYGFERYGIRIGTGCTAVMAPGNYPVLQAQQITGIIGGLKGASEYEKLMNYRGDGARGMDSQSVIHVFIIILIFLGNITYFILERRRTVRG
jgi:hypothetical protein